MNVELLNGSGIAELLAAQPPPANPERGSEFRDALDDASRADDPPDAESKPRLKEDEEVQETVEATSSDDPVVVDENTTPVVPIPLSPISSEPMTTPKEVMGTPLVNTEQVVATGPVNTSAETVAAPVTEGAVTGLAKGTEATVTTDAAMTETASKTPGTVVEQQVDADVEDPKLAATKVATEATKQVAEGDPKLQQKAQAQAVQDAGRTIVAAEKHGSTIADPSQVDTQKVMADKPVAREAEATLGNWFQRPLSNRIDRVSGDTPQKLADQGTEITAQLQATPKAQVMQAAEAANPAIAAEATPPAAPAARSGVPVNTGIAPVTPGATHVQTPTGVEVTGTLSAPLATASRAAHAAAATGTTDEPAVDRSALANKLYRVVRRTVSNGGGEVHLRLDPPKLGRVDIKAQLDGSRLDLAFKVEHEGVRDAILKHIDELHKTLESYGIDSENLTIDLRQDGNQADSEGGSLSSSTPRDDNSAQDAETAPEEEDLNLITADHVGSKLDLSG